jgi:hypothetical protein
VTNLPWDQPGYGGTAATKKKKRAAKKKKVTKKKAKKKAKKKRVARKRRPKVGKAPTARRSRAVSLRDVRGAFTDQELDSMGDAGRSALSDVRLGRVRRGRDTGDPYEIGVAGAVYKIPAEEAALQDFLWRLGEAERNPSRARILMNPYRVNATSLPWDQPSYKKAKKKKAKKKVAKKKAKKKVTKKKAAKKVTKKVTKKKAKRAGGGGPAWLRHRPAANQGVVVECFHDGKKLRVRPVRGQGYEIKNVQFPRALRHPGCRYTVDGLVDKGTHYRAVGEPVPFEQGGSVPAHSLPPECPARQDLKAQTE